MNENQKVVIFNTRDNVATALSDLKEGDTVEIKKVGNNDIVNHTYSDPFSNEEKKIIGAYSIVSFSDGKSIVETIDRREIDLIKSKSKTKEKDGKLTVWQEWETEMIKK